MTALSRSTAARMFLCFVVFFAGAAAWAHATSIDFSRYAAVAFSKSTGHSAYAWNYGSRTAAEKAALAKCTESDAKIVGWVQGGWLALAVGVDNGYGVAWEYGDGALNTVAVERAIDECHEHGESVKKVILICSGDIEPQVLERDAS